jgi:hypothetical protein
MESEATHVSQILEILLLARRCCIRPDIAGRLLDRAGDAEVGGPSERAAIDGAAASR